MTSLASSVASGHVPRALLPSSRATLVFGAVAALAWGFAPADPSPAAVDSDLALVLRGMAAIKGGLAALALAACFWRLARPAVPWRSAVYVAGPPLMAAGAIALWRLEALGLAAVGLHLGLFALLAAALTDPDFVTLPGRRSRTARRVA